VARYITRWSSAVFSTAKELRHVTMVDIEEMIAAINAALAKFTSDRVIEYDTTHFYLFEGGLEELSPTGLRARRISFDELLSLYEAFSAARARATSPSEK
jgi:hypothetical protein